MANNLIDLCRFYSTTTGTTTTVSVGAHVPGFCTPAEAGAADTLVYSYSIYDPVTPAWEKGSCVYNAAGPTLTLTVATSSNANARISLSGTQIINLTALSSDLASLAPVGIALLATLTLSGTAVSDTTHINATYNTYYLVFENCTVSATATWSILFSVNGGSSYLTTGYVNSATVSTTYGAIIRTDISPPILFSSGASTGAPGTGLSGQLVLSNPNGAIAYGAHVSGAMTGMNLATTPTMNAAGAAFSNSTASAINAIKFTTVAGTATLGGKIKIYGVP